MKANLLVSYEPTHETLAKEEASSLLSSVKEKPTFLEADTPGLFKISIKDARKTVKDLSKMYKKDKEKFKYTCNYIPIDDWCKSAVADMQKKIKAFDKIIKNNEKWKMELHKRNYKDDGKLIIKLTEVINKPKVDLEKPDKIVRVEIIGKEAGIALLNKDELFSVKK